MVGIISQARINSTRLPNKIFLEAECRPFIDHHVERLKAARLPIIIATTDDGSESPIVEYCNRNKINCFRGDEQNVLKRFYDCAVQNDLSVIIRVTSDCPLIDGSLISGGLSEFNKYPGRVYYSNALQRTYPRGMDYEIFSFRLLEDAYNNAVLDSDKEHVTPWIWNNRSGDVKLVHDLNETDNSDLRITLDTEEDRVLISKLIEEFDASRLNCSQIVDVLRKNPGLIDINKAIKQKHV